ncbi:hypothetical protein [Microbacterium sp. MYb64]|uniref:hypothetical protein n=1 Tax=Microbacterium sp. MYb64 TaxID=1848691 RepID=UPI0011B043F5|nr:hypothetical protein [Microbacterium sp. MYb64]
MTSEPIQLDPLLQSRIAQPRVTVRCGDVDLTEFVTRLEITEHERVPSAIIILEGAPLPQFDFMARVDALRYNDTDPVFTGTITDATRTGNRLTLNLFGMTELREQGVAPWATHNVPPPDLMQMLVRDAGFASERIQIDTSLHPAAELFEIAVPIVGCDIGAPIPIANDVRLIPFSRDWEARFVQHGEALDHLQKTYAEAGALAVTYVHAQSWMSDAEKAGLRRINSSIDWLVVLLRNGSSARNQRPVEQFTRANFRGKPNLAPAVLVTGVRSHRSWLRDLRSTSHPDFPAVADALINTPAPRRDWQSQNSYAAFRRAANEELPTALRVSALWEALEYYAADVAGVPPFRKTELRALRRRAITGLNDAQTKRIEFAISQLNSTSLQERIWVKAEKEGTLIAYGERQLIARLRAYRNAMVHGGGEGEIERRDMEHAVSIVSRLLIGSANAKGDHRS